MNQPAGIQRPQTRLWQFSIAHLLLLTLLVAVVFAAFRWDLIAGIVASLVSVAVPIVVVRTRASIRAQEPIWNALQLPHSIRRQQTVRLGIRSGVIVAFAVFFYSVAFIAALLAGTFVLMTLMILPRSPASPLDWMETVISIVCLAIAPLGVGSLSGIAWLRYTWPQPESPGNDTSHPSAKNC